MLASLKTRLRRMRRDGKAIRLINRLAYLNYQIKNLRDWLGAERLSALLGERAFSSDTDKLVHFTMTQSGGVIRPIQHPWEISALMKRVRAKRPQAIVEIGTAKGGTLFLFCQHAAENATIISLDLPYGRNGGGYPRWKEKLYRKFAKAGQRLHLVRADSHLEKTRRTIERLLGGRPVDILMIDADHSYDGVRRDFELYSPLLAPDGFAVLHDVIPNRFDPEIEVHRFWNELKAMHDTEELVANYDQGNLGIGIVRLKRASSAPAPGKRAVRLA
jgi:predicted O-methyltransferase YrrM